MGKKFEEKRPDLKAAKTERTPIIISTQKVVLGILELQ